MTTEPQTDGTWQQQPYTAAHGQPQAHIEQPGYYQQPPAQPAPDLNQQHYGFQADRAQHAAPQPAQHYAQPAPQPYGHQQMPPVVSGPPSQPYSTPPQGYGPPPHYPVAQAFHPTVKPKHNKGVIILGVILGVIMLGCLGAAFGGGGDKSSGTSTGSTSTGKSAAKMAAMNTPVRDGKFEFVVTDLDCSQTTLGGEFLNTTAQGKFCLVTVSVKNIGDKAQMFSGGNQKAYDSTGAEFENDGGAEIYANDHAETFLNDINPGNTVTGKIVFDVPSATSLAYVELHDSAFSGGEKVALR